MSNELKTPSSTPRRRLGLRRIIQRKTPLANSKELQIQNMKTPTELLQQKLTIESPSTPIATIPKPLVDTPQSSPVSKENVSGPIFQQPTSFSTGRLKTRTSLNRKVTKKRLDFLAINPLNTSVKQDVGESTSNETNSNDLMETNDSSLIIETLKGRIQQRKSELEAIDKYDKEINELKGLIKTWKNGFDNVLSRLQSYFNPPQSAEMILNHFKIPEEFLNFN